MAGSETGCLTWQVLWVSVGRSFYGMSCQLLNRHGFRVNIRIALSDQFEHGMFDDRLHKGDGPECGRKVCRCVAAATVPRQRVSCIPRHSFTLTVIM